MMRLLVLLALLVGAPALAEEEITINSMHSDPLAKSSFEAAVLAFKKANPDIKVKVNNTSHEAYKVQIRTWLPTNPPDVATWFAGNRANYFIERDLIEPIDDVWQGLDAAFPESVRNLVTVKGKRYLMPVSYYHWGFYYRQDLFRAAGVTPPKTWDELKSVSTTLKSKGLIPIAIGTKNAWPAAAWFDFVDMRVNGYDFHMRLLAGKEKYTDARVKKAMTTWQELIQLQAFAESGPAMNWQESAALLWQGKAAMLLMGNFVSGEAPAGMREKLGFFPFPEIDSKVGRAEVAPTDVYFIPAKAKNKPGAKRFLAFLGQASTQSLINSVSRLLPTNSQADFDRSDSFLVEGLALLTSAKGISQFYDRDADPQVAEIGMNGFVEFLRYPERADAILERIERARQRIHGG